MSSEYRGHRLSIDCPHCGARARVRSSRQLTPLVRSANLQCSNVECGHTFAAQLHVTHTIAPSATPRPEIVLPLAPRRQPALHAANDNGGQEVPPTGPPAGSVRAVP